MTDGGADTDTYISIMDTDTDVVHGAGSLKSGLSVDDEYYYHDGSRENLQQHINTSFILNDNNWKECKLKHNKNKNVAKKYKFAQAQERPE